MISQFYDTNKKGTVVISTYRSGTHYVTDSLMFHLGGKIIATGLGELDTSVIPHSNNYSVSIINAVVPKITLVKQQNLLDDYHVIKLTRNDKINHWISYYVWKEFNTVEQRFNDSNLPHHGGKREQYSKLAKREYPIGEVENWLLEQYIVNLFNANITIDYSDLKDIESDLCWTPNDYGLTLEDLFTNHLEIKELLQDYTVPHV